jgi:predicted ABC-type ATPase
LPDLAVLAGPNGAGLSAFAPERAAADAGRIMLRRLRQLAGEGKNFAFETTLASRSFAPWIAELRRSSGYRFQLVYLWLPSAELAIARVEERVRLGGHSIPPDVIRRRHARGLANFLSLYRPIADAWALYDNSSEARLIAKREQGSADEILDAEAWRMVEQAREAREQEPIYGAEVRRPGIMGLPIEQITRSLHDASRDARRRHKALGHPIVIRRDGKVVVVPPEEIKI